MDRNKYKQLETDIISFRPELGQNVDKSFRWADRNCLSILANDFANIGDVHYLYSIESKEVGFHVHYLVYKPLYDSLKLQIKDERLIFIEEQNKCWLGYIRLNQKVDIDSDYEGLVEAFKLLYDLINPIIIDYIPRHVEYSSYRIWLIWNKNKIIQSDYIGIGAEYEGYRYLDFNSAEEFKKAYKEDNGKSPEQIPISYCELSTDVKEGDMIVAFKTEGGHKYIYGWGRFTTDVIPDPSKLNSYIRKISWIDKYESNPLLADFITSTYFFQKPNLDQLYNIVNLLKIGKQDIKQDMKYREYIDLLTENHNLILTGAPGTGKTYMAKKIAIDMGAKSEFVQFHPSYDYTDFVEGLRPIEKGDDHVGFRRMDGIFKDFCKRAILSGEQDTSQKKPYVMIIDEINRGELSKIFGELFSAIDPGYRGPEGEVKTQYQNLVEEGDVFAKGFYVPENVYILATMNDIDRSVESMDFAMRRRFTWKEVTPDERAGMLDDELDSALAMKAKVVMARVNKEIAKTDGLGEAFMIGPSYFLKLKKYNGDFAKLWKLNIEPLLKEYLRGFRKAGDILADFKSAYFDEKDNVSNSDEVNEEVLDNED